MGVMMDNYDYDRDIEKGEVNVKLEGGFMNDCDAMVKEFKCGGTNNDGVGDGNVLNKDEERGMLSFDSSSDDGCESVRVIVVEKTVVEGNKESRDVGRKVVKEKPKAVSAKKKHPKPPRPPRGMSLDSTDQKLIKELHELARVKRARAERMKALKKAKESKPSSSKNQLFATLLTILFCAVLLLQGISSRTSPSTSIRGTPFSSEIVRQHNIISVQQHPVSSTSDVNVPNSNSPRQR
ncbi:hypothetical protein vseg_014817 [Gypsophila vaccaria]